MTLSQLRYAVAVDTHRHFGRAAEVCFVSQPSLSAGLKKLEEELGAALFDRSRQPIVPTEVGRRVVTKARTVLQEADALATLAVPLTEPVGELRLGVIPTVASALLPLVAVPFSQRYPRATLSVRELTTDAILDHLSTERIDAGIVATPEGRPNVYEMPLYDEPFVAYVGDGHRMECEAEVTCELLAHDDVWLLSEGHCLRDQVLHLCGSASSSSSERRVRFESGNLETLRRMVDRSGGVTLLPRLATLHLTDEERRRTRPLAAPVPQRQVRMLASRAQLKRALVEAFSETVRDVVRTASEGLVSN